MTGADQSYIAAVDAALWAAHGSGAETFAALLSDAQGADPVLVAERLAETELPVRMAPAEVWRPVVWTPQLHALRSEWYFTSGCAAQLAARFGRGRLGCLGAPTVAAAAETAVLFDRDAEIQRSRFGATIDTIMDLDLGSTTSLPTPGGPLDACIVDPPWYAPHPLRWLALAAAAVRPGGTVAIVVPPALQRPSAPAERAAVLGAAQAMGDAVLETKAVRYATPLFEVIAMQAAGIALPSDWRTADLVQVRVEQPCPPPGAAVPSVSPQHDTFRIGDQLVMLSGSDRGGAPALTPIERTNNFVWDRVSARDPRVPTIDLWTSQGRVATVHGRPAIHRALTAVAEGERVDDADVAAALCRVGVAARS